MEHNCWKIITQIKILKYLADMSIGQGVIKKPFAIFKSGVNYNDNN